MNRFYLLLTLLLGIGLTHAQAQDKGIKIVGGTAPAGTERRIALVVGNKDYQNVRKLKNPVNDATDMSVVLGKLGFEVITLTNATYQQLSAGLNRFKDKLTTTDVALLYYSGHGVSYNGKNYLLPVDADIQCIEQVDEYGIALNRILSDLASRNVKTSFVFLDACRNLPEMKICDATKRDLTVQPGLVKPTNNPRGSMVVYATDESGTADDNVGGRNGLFTEALLRFIGEPNLTIRTILDKTSLAVEDKSGGKQSPGRYDKILGDFVFIQSQASTLVNPSDIQAEISEGIKAYKDKDYSKAFRLLIAHSQDLDPASQNTLGYMYDTGNGTGVDQAEALKWYRKAADQGNVKGQVNLGIMYENGEGGLSVDKAEAVKWYRKAADQGDAQGQTSLGVMYENGSGGLSVDYVEAVKWYRKAADQGNALGQAYLADMYENGSGITKDLETAILYYRLAARQGDDFAKKALTRWGRAW